VPVVQSSRRLRSACLAAVAPALVLALASAERLGAQQSDGAAARSPVLEFPNLGPVPGSFEPSLGPADGSLDAEPRFEGGTAGSGVLGGRQRTGRVPRGQRHGPLGSQIAATRGMQLPESLPAPEPRAPAGTAAPGVPLDAAILDEPGPADGITLDAAIDRMMATNLDLRALRHELTQADADVLTAGLRTNPLVYMDTQFIPYGQFSRANPGGPTQYDINITHPFDLSQKRQARTVVARMARSTIEAQFQDVTRRQIDNLYRAYVNLQAARIDLLSTRATVARQERFLEDFARRARPDDEAATDGIDHIALVLEQTRGAVGEAEEAFADAQEGLAVLLGVPVHDVAGLAPRDPLRMPFPAPPTAAELTALALRCRPDLRASRLGVHRAGAEVQLQRANRFDDVYLFYDPFTYQDNAPFGAPGATSWALGLTFALPVYNRNQGNIARAESNVSQTKLELAAVERRIAAEVRLAEREYDRSRQALEQIERAILPRITATLDRKTAEFRAGRLSADEFAGHLDDATDVARSRTEALVRHRRAMLGINTAVGLRVLP